MKVTITDILFFFLLCSFLFLATYTYGLERTVEDLDYKNQICNSDLRGCKKIDCPTGNTKEAFTLTIPNFTK